MKKLQLLALSMLLSTSIMTVQASGGMESGEDAAASAAQVARDAQAADAQAEKTMEDIAGGFNNPPVVAPAPVASNPDQSSSEATKATKQVRKSLKKGKPVASTPVAQPTQPVKIQPKPIKQ